MLVKCCLKGSGKASHRIWFEVEYSLCDLRRKQGRVKKGQLAMLEDLDKGIASVCWLGDLELRRMLAIHHMGVDRTLDLNRNVDSNFTRQSIQKVVGSCDECQTIDPVPSVHELGKISVECNWR